MNTIRRYAADDAHVIFGTAYDEGLGDQLRVTVIATGLSPAKRMATPISVVQGGLRTGTDNMPILNTLSTPASRRAARPRAARLQPAQHAERVAQWSDAGRGEGGCVGEQWDGRDRDPCVSEKAGGLTGQR